MKKSALIALLNTVKGNPEIKIYNGFVDDWMNISPEIMELWDEKFDYETGKSKNRRILALGSKLRNKTVSGRSGKMRY